MSHFSLNLVCFGQIDHKRISNSKLQVNISVDQEPYPLNFVYQSCLPIFIIACCYGTLATSFRWLRLNGNWNTKQRVVYIARHVCLKVNLVNHSICSCTLWALDFEVWFQMFEGKYFRLVLKVSAIIPFDYRIFYLTNSTQVAMNLHNLVRVLLMMIFVVS